MQFSRITLRVVAFLLLIAGASLLAEAPGRAAAADKGQQLTFTGLRASAGKGQFNAVATDQAGNLYALYDQKDGIRILKVSGDGSTLLGQVLLGGPGDAGTALAISPSGTLFVAGTSFSGGLSATGGAAISSWTPGAENGFVAGFNPALELVFVTYTGGTRLAPSAIAASDDAVFVTGITYADDLPVTPNAVQPYPAIESTQNGFVERFSADGTSLGYATYVTGAFGETTPTGITADAAGNVWLVGSTSASGFPTIAALVPESLSNPSGFLMQLDPAGDGVVFSTFVPGSGLDAIALDASGQDLLITGTVALGQFPIDTVSRTLVDAPYKVLLKLPKDGSTVLSGTMIAPAGSSVVSAAPDGTAWVGGSLVPGSFPWLPGLSLAGMGNGFAVHVTTAGSVDQTLRLGGVANQELAFASLPTMVAGLAVDRQGSLVVAGFVQPTSSANLSASETFDLPLRTDGNAALPSAIKDARIDPAACNGSLCAGSAGYLSSFTFSQGAPSLTFSMDDLPRVLLRNVGSLSAEHLQISSSGGTVSSDCPDALAPGSLCAILMSGGAPGVITALPTNGPAASARFPAFSKQPQDDGLAFHPREVNFDIRSSGDAPAQREITVSNLGSADVTFVAALVRASPTASSPFTEPAGSCRSTAVPGSFLLAAGASCQLTIVLNATGDAANDGLVQAALQIGSEQALLTGFLQSKSLRVSSPKIEFGTQYEGGIQVPRYFYLMNNGGNGVPHAMVVLPTASPFEVSDECPSTLLPFSVCRLRVDYFSSQVPSSDSVTVALDAGLTVLLSGATKPEPTAGGSTVSPSLIVTPTFESFAEVVPVTGVSGATQTVAISNNGTSDFSLSLLLNGDFIQSSSCGTILAAGATCGIALQFAPSLPGVRQGVLTVIAGEGSGTVSVPLLGNATAILADNNGLVDLGSSPLGQPSVRFLKVLQPFANFAVSATGPYRVTLIEDTGFGHGTPPVSAFVPSGSGTCHNCWIGISFDPRATGVQSGILTISSNLGGNPYQLDLKGQGEATAGLIATPSTAQFGALPVSSASKSTLITLTNLSSSGLPVALISETTTGDFSIESSQLSGDTCGTTLDYTASCTVTLQFGPTATGPRDGMLAIASSVGSLNVHLTGTGTADPGISLSPIALDFVNRQQTVQSILITNTSSQSALIGTPTNTTDSFSLVSDCGLLPPGGLCTITVTFIAGPANVTDEVRLPVSPTPGQTSSVVYAIALTGLYTAAEQGLSISPSTSDFGASPTGILGPGRLFTLTNESSGSLEVNIKVPRNFALESTTCKSLAPGEGCPFRLRFAPLTSGSLPGTIDVTGTAQDGVTSYHASGYAEGFGVGSGTLNILDPRVDNGSYDFGQVSSGQSILHTFTVTHQGSPFEPDVQVRRVTSGPPFLATTDCVGPIASGTSCSVNVTFLPGSAGSSNSLTNLESGALIIESDALSAPTTINLRGQVQQASLSTGSLELLTLSLSQGSLFFPSVVVGSSSAAETLSLSNTGTRSVRIQAVTTSSDFSARNHCTSLAPAATCIIEISSTPQSSGTHLASLEIVSDAASPLDFVSLISTATPGSLTFKPASLNFGPLRIGSSSTLPVGITNSSRIPVLVRSLSASKAYTVSGTCSTNQSLLPGASCTSLVTFSPSITGPANGLLSVDNSASVNPLVVPLAGAGIPVVLVATPAVLTFGNVAVGASANRTFTLRNIGASSAGSITATASGVFAVVAPCFTAILAPGASCVIEVSFNPATPGPASSSLVVTSSSPGVSVTLALTGSAVEAPDFTLTVDGGALAVRTLPSGQTATYALALAGTNGFAADIALTCTPVETSLSVACSLLPPLVVVGDKPQTSTASITTISPKRAANMTSPSPGLTATLAVLIGGVFLLPLGRRLHRNTLWKLGAMLVVLSVFSSGCGSGSKAISGSNVNYAAPGTYHFVVSANTIRGSETRRQVYLTMVLSAP